MQVRLIPMGSALEPFRELISPESDPVENLLFTLLFVLALRCEKLTEFLRCGRICGQELTPGLLAEPKDQAVLVANHIGNAFAFRAEDPFSKEAACTERGQGFSL